jgi:large subunit ribosomal protein L31
MKSGIHPEYREVVFQDISSDFAILTRSTIESKDTIKWEDGKEYPLVKVEVSSASQQESTKCSIPVGGSIASKNATASNTVPV